LGKVVDACACQIVRGRAVPGAQAKLANQLRDAHPLASGAIRAPAEWEWAAAPFGAAAVPHALLRIARFALLVEERPDVRG
jgi:hypothetical protein